MLKNNIYYLYGTTYRISVFSGRNKSSLNVHSLHRTSCLLQLQLLGQSLCLSYVVTLPSRTTRLKDKRIIYMIENTFQTLCIIFNDIVALGVILTNFSFLNLRCVLTNHMTWLLYTIRVFVPHIYLYPYISVCVR